MGRKITEPRGGKLPPPDYHKFMTKVVCMLDTMCWEWVSPSVIRRGYGKISIANHDKPTTAHRYAYIMYNGPVDKGEIIMHLCDNPKCCNPAHLQKGTQSQNIKDMYARKRDKQRQARRKMTDAQVAELRAKYIPGRITLAMLAKEYGISIGGVSKVIRGQTYSAAIEQSISHAGV